MSMFANQLSASPADIQRKRDIVQKLLMNAQQTQPQTIGEGLGAVGDYIYAGRMGRSADAGDAENMKRLDPIIQALQGGRQASAATPQEPSMMPENVNVNRIPPPGYSDSVTVGGDGMEDIAPPVQPGMPELGAGKTQSINNPQFFNPRTAEAGNMRVEGGRMIFKGMDDDQLMGIYADPQARALLEHYLPGYNQLITDEVKFRQGFGKETRDQSFRRNERIEGQDFTVDQQRRGFKHDRGMVDLRERAGLESEAIKQGYGSVEELLAAGGTRASQKSAAEITEGQQKVISSARSGIDVLTALESLYNDEGVADITGPVDQIKPTFLLGEAGNRALTKHNQVQGQAFLEAYERLKGGGPITDIEGKKGTEAIQRIQRALTEKEYRAAVREFAEITQGITVRRLQAAGVPEEQWPAVVRNGLTRGQSGVPEGVSEEDIQFTMQKHGLTREQVLERLR